MLTYSNIIQVLKPLLNDNFVLKENFENKTFKSVSNNSLNIGLNDVFVAIRGESTDGHKYIKDAISRGASLVIVQYAKDIIDEISGVLFLVVSDSYKAYAFLAELQYNFPANRMDMYAVTGTNGKTTCAYLLKSILEFENTKYSKVGLLSTVEYSCGDENISAERTTPEALKFQELLDLFLQKDCNAVVMEVSSHSLVQQRIANTKFNFAVFTNLTGDHLDYHLNMENYFQAKVLLFQNHLKEGGKAVVNIDDEYGEHLTQILKPKQYVTYGFNKNADFQIIPSTNNEDSDSTNFMSSFQILFSGKFYDISLPMPGRFNMANATAVFAVAFLFGISSDVIARALNSTAQIPGRMQTFKLPNGAVCFVDYAHTDDALFRVLTELDHIKLSRNGRILCVFGCGGDRDKSKRPRMATVANEFSDEIIVTSDNPRTENPEQIIQDIITTLPENSNYLSIIDREEAIKHALISAKTEDIVLIAGKGHENYQEINGIKHPFDDCLVVNNFINNSKNTYFKESNE